jgi:excisionase family DNA binding protein
VGEEIVISVRGLTKAVLDELRSSGIVTPRLMSLKQAATYLGMTEDALRFKASTGKIPVVAIDSRMRFDKEDLDQMIREHKRGAA